MKKKLKIHHISKKAPVVFTKFLKRQNKQILNMEFDKKEELTKS